MNKNESKYFNTAILFDEALINLLENKDIYYITIKEICNKAGVNRSTFYLHYESINDLLDETMNYINKKFIDFFNVKSRDFVAKIEEIPVEQLNLVSEEYLVPYLKFIKENKKIFKASFNKLHTLELRNPKIYFVYLLSLTNIAGETTPYNLLLLNL